MTIKETDKIRRLYDALKAVAQCDTPDQLKRDSQNEYGVEYDEALEMAYENVRQIARNAVRRMRRP